MIILYILGGLIVIWAISNIVAQKRDDERNNTRELEELEKAKQIAELENQIRMLKGK